MANDENQNKKDFQIIDYKSGEYFEGLALTKKLEKLGVFYDPKTAIDKISFIPKKLRKNISIIIKGGIDG